MYVEKCREGHATPSLLPHTHTHIKQVCSVVFIASPRVNHQCVPHSFGPCQGLTRYVFTSLGEDSTRQVQRQRHCTHPKKALKLQRPPAVSINQGPAPSQCHALSATSPNMPEIHHREGQVQHRPYARRKPHRHHPHTHARSLSRLTPGSQYVCPAGDQRHHAEWRRRRRRRGLQGCRDRRTQPAAADCHPEGATVSHAQKGEVQGRPRRKGTTAPAIPCR